MYMCSSCGENDKFEGTLVRVSRHNVEIYGGSEEVNYDSAADQSFYNEADEEIVDLRCRECNSAKIESLATYKDVAIFKWKHIDKKGEWHKRELPENKRDDKIILEAGLNEL